MSEMKIIDTVPVEEVQIYDTISFQGTLFVDRIPMVVHKIYRSTDDWVFADNEGRAYTYPNGSMVSIMGH